MTSMLHLPVVYCDIRYNFAEFLLGTIQMLYKTKTHSLDKLHICVPLQARLCEAFINAPVVNPIRLSPARTPL